MGIIALSFVIFPHVFADLFISKSHSNKEMAVILPITIMLLRFVAFYSFFDSANIIFSCAIRGAGDTMFVMIISIFSIIALAFPTYIAVYWLEAGLTACWTIATVYISALSFVFFLRFKLGKWKKMRVIEMPSSVM